MFVCLSQWIANPLNDMYADAVATVVLEVQSNPKAQKRENMFHISILEDIFTTRYIHHGIQVS